MKSDLINEKIEKAIQFAARVHEGQKRKSSENLPYVSHCYSVGIILLNNGNLFEDVIIAGILHDVIEDTSISFNELKDIFGQSVADYVKRLSNPPELESNYLKRKEWQYKHFSKVCEEVKTIKAADILHNLYTIIQETKDNKENWNKFDKTPSQTVISTKKLIKILSCDMNKQIISQIEKNIKILEELH